MTGVVQRQGNIGGFMTYSSSEGDEEGEPIEVEVTVMRGLETPKTEDLGPA